MGDAYSGGAAVTAANIVIALYVYMAFTEEEDPPYEESGSTQETTTESNTKSKQSWRSRFVGALS